jgi:hypothetical protein
MIVPWNQVPVDGFAFYPGDSRSIGKKIDESTFRCNKLNGPGFVDFKIDPALNQDDWKLAFNTQPLNAIS